MVLAMGCGRPGGRGMFHLVDHAFFSKAMLFLMVFRLGDHAMEGGGRANEPVSARTLRPDGSFCARGAHAP